MTSPKRFALLQSPVPCPPQPTKAMPGRSFGLRVLGVAAEACSRARNHAGKVAPATAIPELLRKCRRFTRILNEFMCGFQSDPAEESTGIWKAIWKRTIAARLARLGASCRLRFLCCAIDLA